MEEKPRKLPVSPSEGVSTNSTFGVSRWRYDMIAFALVIQLSESRKSRKGVTARCSCCCLSDDVDIQYHVTCML